MYMFSSTAPVPRIPQSTLDAMLRNAVKSVNVAKVKELVAMGASPARELTFFEAVETCNVEICNMLLQHDNVGLVINGTGLSWPPFEAAMVYYLPEIARNILHHPAFDCNKTKAPWQFQKFVFREIGARKHWGSGNRWANVDIQRDIAEVAKEWFIKNKLNPPEVYYERNVLTVPLNKEQIMQFIAMFKLDEGTVLIFPIIGLIIEFCGIQLTKDLMKITGFKRETDIFTNNAGMNWHSDDRNPLRYSQE